MSNLKFPATSFELCKRLLNYLNQASKPHSKYFNDPMRLEIAHRRRITFIAFELIVLTRFIFNFLMANGPLTVSIQGITIISAAIFFAFYSTRYHPQVFYIGYNAINFIFITGLSKHGNEGVHLHLFAMICLPFLVYLFTGSIVHFLINAGGHAINMAFFCPKLLERTLLEMHPSLFVASIRFASLQNFFFLVCSTVFSHFIIQRVYQQADIATEKAKYLENQKHFLLGFSHELRNLLNNLMGNLNLATLENLSEKARDLLKNAEVCSQLLLHLVNNILDTGKVEIGDLEINPEPTHIYDSLEKVWGICSELIKKKKLHGRMCIQKDIPQVVTIDHYRLSQILLNLVGNAVKFTEKGMISLNVQWIQRPMVDEAIFQPCPYNSTQDDLDEDTFEKEQNLCYLGTNVTTLNFFHKKIDKCLLSSAERRNSRGVLKITVSDTGVGITDEGLGKLFQKFSQVSDDASKRKLGTGLGLYITKELCNRMNGDIRFFSKKNKGSTVIFAIPVDPVPQQQPSIQKMESLECISAQRTLRAMVIDDENFSRSILSTYLSKLGVSVVDTAENGLIAHEKFQKRATTRAGCIDIVTMDLEMPILNGKLSAEKIRETERAAGLNPCLLFIVSGNCSESEIRQCTDKNGKIRADAFLKKPASMDDLKKVISNHLTSINR